MNAVIDNKKDGKKLMEKLVTRFKNNMHHYKTPEYNETEIRTEFIDKFFMCLGWDVDNENGIQDSHKDVVKESTVHVEGRPKNADYAFRLGSDIAFYVEAKKPSENLQNNPKHAYQIKNYSWNSKIPISILTDFEEFIVYDCQHKPNRKDPVYEDRKKIYTYIEYVDKFDELWELFSKEKVWRGSIEKFAKTTLNRRGTGRVDTLFLNDMENWREILAKNIAKNNKNKLKIHELNKAVQTLLDRIIFLRICEDRNIEDWQQLYKLASKNDIYRELLFLFDLSDKKYNSGLFSQKHDSLMRNILLDDDTLKKIILDLYPPNSEYNFAVLSVEILGSIYEKFLGKIITLTPSGNVKIVEKEDVKIAGGVVYTPEFVVTYIIKNTVGVKIKGLTPKQIEKIKILDPACGSGTFLVKAYNYLLQYHLDYYLKNTAKYKNEIYQINKNKWILSTNIRRRILLNNIFGLDVDSYAVEITKLSLMLKVLENQTKESIYIQRKLSPDPALPDLEKNILCKNALIDKSIYTNDLFSNVKTEDELKIRPFNWSNPDTKLGEIVNKGGFDVIIGNPPYVKEDKNRLIFHHAKASTIKKYYAKYMDYWYFFTCKALDHLKENGLHSFIADNNWIANAGGKKLRAKILDDAKIETYIDFNNYMIFEDRSIQTMIFKLKKQIKIPKKYKINYKKITAKNLTKDELKNNMISGISHPEIETLKIDFESSQSDTISFLKLDTAKIIKKIMDKSNTKLESSEVEIGMGITNEYVKKKNMKIMKNLKEGEGIFVLTTSEKKSLNLTKNELNIIKPCYESNNLDRYYSNKQNEKWVIYSDKKTREKINEYPNIKNHLDRFKKIMTSDSKPYGLHRAKNQQFFENKKITVLRKALKPNFTYVEFPCYVTSTFYMIKTDRVDMKYLTALFNSKLSHYVFYHIFKRQGEQLQIDKDPLLKFPIIIPQNNHDKSIMNTIIDLVDKIRKEHIELKLADSITSDIILEHIDDTSQKINFEIYKLYDLNSINIDTIESFSK